MKITGVGTDLVRISRINRLITDYGSRFLNKIFTPAEVDQCQMRSRPATHFAGRLAAKEALAKALYQTGQMSVIPWTRLEILTDEYGRPRAASPSAVDQILHVSISHDGEFALAFAIVQAQ